MFWDDFMMISTLLVAGYRHCQSGHEVKMQKWYRCQSCQMSPPSWNPGCPSEMNSGKGKSSKQPSYFVTKKTSYHCYPVDFPLDSTGPLWNLLQLPVQSSPTWGGLKRKALESVDFDPVSVFWENQQNSEEHVIRASVTGSQWYHACGVSFNARISDPRKGALKVVLFFLTAPSLGMHKIQFWNFPRAEESWPLSKVNALIIIPYNDTWAAGPVNLAQAA